MIKENLKLYLPTESDRVEAQTLVFSIGGKWSGGQKVPLSAAFTHLFIYSAKDIPLMSLSNGPEDDSYFVGKKVRKITLEELRDIVNPSRRFLHQEWFEAYGKNKEVQFAYNKEGSLYKDINNNDVLYIFNDRSFKFRLKPKTIVINGITIEAPSRVAPEKGQDYFIANIASSDGWSSSVWTDVGYDKQTLGRGILHTTKEAAAAHAKALLSFTS